MFWAHIGSKCPVTVIYGDIIGFVLQKQELVNEADEDQFKINDVYLKALPRSNDIMLKALDTKLCQRGQQEPIVVNENMVILDGHTRHDLLGQRGKKIKFTVKKFDSKDEEFEYVIESNIMRRQLTDFAKAETVYEMYMERKKQGKESRGKNYNTYLDILECIKDKPKLIKEIAQGINKNSDYIRQILVTMVDSWYVRMEKVSTGKAHYCKYTILPKGVGFLSEQERVETTDSALLVGKIIGISRASVVRSNYLIKNADEGMLEQLRNGNLTISMAYHLLTTGGKQLPREKRENYKCPHCEHVAKKVEFRSVR